MPEIIGRRGRYFAGGILLSPSGVLALTNAQPFFVQRTCTRKSENADKQESDLLENYRNLPAYVLLGDPGSGKTTAFKCEAKASRGRYITARDFVTLEPQTKGQNKTFFIDALDEMRANGNDGRIPLDQIRKHLAKLQCPRFRLSCREADWLGESDKAALSQMSPNDEVIALHLEPLNDHDILEILRHTEVPDPAEFVRKSNEHKLGELLRNPQTLNLLVSAVGKNEWPQSREEIYAMACQKLASEKNSEHRHATREKHSSPDALLDAAGYLCSIHLLSGMAGFALDENASNDQYFNLNELTTHNLPLLAALKSNLFQRDGEEQRIPTHRSVAEYLGARYLAEQVENNGLPLGRVLALMTADDGGVTPDLRGLAAWLSVHCRSGRLALIERDPLGVVLYGDARNFVVEDKQRVLTALKNEAKHYPWFRSDDWSSSPFGALGTTDMQPAFLNILTSPSREESDQVLLGCVLDAIRYGDVMIALIDALDDVIRDASYWPVIRKNAVRALRHIMPENDSRLLMLAEDIHKQIVEDRDDEILGALLPMFYPCFISPKDIFNYSHAPKDDHLIGSYFVFWNSRLSELTADKDVPLLLDQLVRRHKVLSKLSRREHQYKNMAGEVLTRGLMMHGDTITDERLYNWLGVGLDEYGNSNSNLDKKHTERIANWFKDRPDRYKAIIEHGASLCANQENIRRCMYPCTMRLYYALPPIDSKNWYLEKAKAAQQNELAEYYFYEAVHMLVREGGKQDLTLPALEFIESWVSEHPIFEQWLEPFITCPINSWQQKQHLHEQETNNEQQKQENERTSYCRKHLISIRDGSVNPGTLHKLAEAYSGLIYEASGETPLERLNNFLGGDQELVEAACEGFRHALDRKDLPTVKEIIDLELKGRMHFIRLPCLVGIEARYQSNSASVLQLDKAVLSRLLAFHFSYNIGDDPAWVAALIQTHPSLVAEVLLAYALPLLRAGKERVSGLYPLAYDDAYSEVARIALPALLKCFPLRVRKLQLINMLDPLLKGSVHYLDKKALAVIVSHKLELGSMDVAQRVYWLACGLIIEPVTYEAKLRSYIDKNKVRRGHLTRFLYGEWKGKSHYAVMSEETTIVLLIELLAPDCSPERLENVGLVTPAMETAKLVRSYINTLGGNPNKMATRELERLIASPDLLHWNNAFRHALHTQRIARRKATFHRLGVKEVSQMLANLQPVNAADLAALTLDHLRDIANKIRNGSTNDYEQYWSYGASNKKLEKSKPENDCRDALLSDLNERFGKLGIDAQKEGYYADDKRADIRVSFGGTNGFNVPIEIKKNRHNDMWRGIHEQLIPKYARDPGADGYGIYIVFWFGEKGMKPPPDGKKIRSATELENRLRQTLAPEESHRIQVCVIDCALP